MNNHIQRVAMPICFPSGVRIGAGKESGNLLVQARDGQGQFVLPGSALAGAVRHALQAACAEGEDFLADWFGSHRKYSNELVSSRVKFADSRLCVGKSTSEGVRIRTHNAIDRHRGAPVDGGLFSMESLPAGTTTTLSITVASTKQEADVARDLLQKIVSLFDQGITLGGGAARGIGRAVLSGEAMWKAWSLTELDQHADWLDDCFRYKQSAQPLAGEALSPARLDQTRLSVTMELTVPRGQDFVVADGQGVEYDMEPQQITMANKTAAWLLPGSTIRGLFRAYVTRLAARAGKPVADSFNRWQTRNLDPRDVKGLTGEDLSSGFVASEDRTDFADAPEQIECPVMKLFGSAFAKGRIHIADAVSKQHSNHDVQERAHVAIDRFSGGASDGFLFNNQTLTSGTFTVELTIQDPTNEEAEWIAGCIRALDMGLIRVGSSKGAGRLALQQPPTANGPYAEIIIAVNPMETSCG
ncbi:MAG: RAMP superfamily CRISPR-associated protein [Planctomycetota bacterium]|nr:RAMP superfamily CRISPR-associated protein [Planctomycetota bacterium]